MHTVYVSLTADGWLVATHNNTRAVAERLTHVLGCAVFLLKHVGEWEDGDSPANIDVVFEVGQSFLAPYNEDVRMISVSAFPTTDDELVVTLIRDGGTQWTLPTKVVYDSTGIHSEELRLDEEHIAWLVPILLEAEKSMDLHDRLGAIWPNPTREQFVEALSPRRLRLADPDD